MLRARSLVGSLAGRSVLALVAVAASALPAASDTKTWTGAVSPSWSAAGNWAGGVPAAGDTVVFPVTAANRENTNDLPAGTGLANITFLGGGFTIGGDTIVMGGAIVNGLTPNNCGLANRIDAAISLSGPLSTRGCWGELLLAGAIDLGAHALTLEDSQVTRITGVVSGTGTVGTASGQPTSGFHAVLSGDNTYTGATAQTAGNLEINGNQPASDVTASGYYWTRTAGTGTIGALTTASEVWPGVFNFSTPGGLATGDLTMGSGSRLVIDVTGALPGTGHDQVSVTGVVTLGPGANLTANVSGFTPATGQEFVIVENDGGDAVSGTFDGLPEGGTLSTGVVEFSITYAGGDGNDVVLTCTSAQNTWTGAVDGLWSEPGNWTGGVPVSGESILFPDTGSNRATTDDLPAGTTIGGITFTGGNYTIGGSLDLGGTIANGAYPNNCGLMNRIEASVSLQAPVAIRGCWGQLVVAGTVDLGAHQLTLEDSQMTAVTGVVSGTGGILTTAGTPSLGSLAVLSGNNTYTGATTQNSYFLEIHGAQPASALTAAGAPWFRTAGTGTVGALTTGSEVWPGNYYSNATGRLGTGDLVMNDGSRLVIDLNGGTPGTSHDQVSVTGTVTLGSSVTLAGSMSSFNPTIGQQFTIVENDLADAVSGTFAGLPEGAALTIAAAEFTISYVGGTGNDVVLTCTSAPNTWTGAIDALWSEAGNWTAGVPVDGDSILFPDNALNRANTNDLPAGTTLSNITFLGGDYTIGGNTLHVAGTIASGVYPNNCGFSNRIDAAISLAAPVSTRGCWSQMVLAGAIDLGAHRLTVEDSQMTVLAGVVSGTGTILGLSVPPVAGYPLILQGNNTYTGATTQSSYYMEVHGSQPSSAVTAAGGPWFRTAGRGTMGALTTDGQIWPGTYDGTTTGSLGTAILTMNPGSKLALDLNGPIPGTGYDQLRVAGTASLAPNVTLTSSLAFTPARGQVFVVIENDGTDAVAGAFEGLPEGATLNVGPYPFEISYVGKTGNDVTLTSLSGDPLNAAPVAVEDAWDASTGIALVIAAPGVLDNDSDPDGNPLTVVQWPTATAQGGTVAGNADGSFTYTSAAAFEGTDTFTYVISDGNNATDSATVTLTVVQTNRAPAATDDIYGTGEDVPLVVAAPGVLANDTDADGDALAVTVVDGPLQGSLTLNADGSFTYTPSPNFSGTDGFTYSAVDPDGLADEGAVAITVSPVNDPPVAVADSYSTAEDTPLTVAAPGVLANDSDVEGSVLTAVLVSGPTNGALALNTDGAFTYTPNADFNGADTFSYHANDGASDSQPVTVTITVTGVNDPPTAVGETYSTAEDTTLAVAAPGVLANDSDPEGNALTAALVSGPVNGALALNPDGSFTYAPVGNFNGSDSFTYTAGDGAAVSSVVTVGIDVTAVNDAPDAAADTYAVVEGVLLTVAAPGVLGNDVDADNDALAATLVTGPASGVLTLAADGSFEYNANAGFRGTDTFAYRATDASGAFDDATVTLTVTASADLRVTITDAPDPQRPGGGVTYAVVVTNDGPSRAGAVTLVDTLPSGTRLLARPTTSQGTCSLGTGTVTCLLGPLAAGASATLSLVVTADASGTITNSAVVSGTDPDPAAGNDADQETTTIGFVSAAPTPLAMRIDFGAGTGTAPLTLQNDAPVPFDYVLQELPGTAVAGSIPAAGFDVPWLSLSPTAGTVPAMSNGDVTATFDATGLSPALYRAAVGVDGSPFTVADVPVCFTVGFLDVAPGAFAEGHIHALAGAAVTGGCTASTFCPDGLLPRAAMAIWLLRAKEGPAYVPPPATGTVFLDIPATHFAAAYIEELQRRGVTNGCGSGNFCPVHPVTRSSMAVFLLKTLEGVAYVPPPATGVFTDVPVSSSFAPWVEELARRGITGGCGGGNFCPDQEVVRAQSAVLTVATFALPMCGQ